MPLRPDSLASRITELDVGETLSLSERLPVRSEALDLACNRARARLKNKVSPVVARARKASGGTFTVETVAVQTHDFSAVIVTVAVTRLSRGRKK